MDYENVLGEHKFPTYEELKSGLLRLIDEGKISREDAARVLPALESEKPMNLDFEQELYNRFGMVKDFTLGMRIAQAFYDLGCRRTADKYDEIEYNRQRAEEHLATSGKTLEIKPGDEVTINGHKIVYDKDKDAITMEEIPEDLEEAAEKYFIKVPCSEEVKKTLIEIYKPGIDAFIAGAKWQEDHIPLPEDTVLFNKGVEEGKRLMMEEAMEGEVMTNGFYPYEPRIVAPYPNCPYDFGDKVRVIVLPKED